jgi:hypothetical protein
MIAKPISIKLTGGKSGGCASKAVEPTSEDLRLVTKSVVVRRRRSNLPRENTACHGIVTEHEVTQPDRAGASQQRA